MKANESEIFCKDCSILCETYFYTDFISYWIQYQRRIRLIMDYLTNNVFWVNSVISYNENWSESVCLDFIIYKHFGHNLEIR
jgi:hypothetical protein